MKFTTFAVGHDGLQNGDTMTTNHDFITLLVMKFSRYMYLVDFPMSQRNVK